MELSIEKKISLFTLVYYIYSLSHDDEKKKQLLSHMNVTFKISI